MTNRIGITLGDVTGVGPEVTLKALASEAAADETRYLLIGDPGSVQRLNQPLKSGTIGVLRRLTRLKLFFDLRQIRLYDITHCEITACARSSISIKRAIIDQKDCHPHENLFPG